METNSPKILIVEDSEAAAKLLAATLSEKNYDITGIAETGEEAVQIVKNSPPDLIFMDIELKGDLDGIETTRIIKSIADLPVIFLTGTKDLKYLDRILEIFPSAYLTKPFKSTELFITIETSLYKHRMIKEIRESEERLNAIWNNIQTAIIIADGETDIIQNINPKASEIIGLQSDEIIGRSNSEFFLYRDNDLLSQTRPESVDPAIKEAILLNYNKEKIPIFKTNTKIKLKDRVYSLISFADASLQKKNEMEIVNARDEIQNLLSSLVTILIGVSIKDEVTHWNKIAENTFGITENDALGIPLTQCKIKWDWPTVYEGIYKSISDDSQVRLIDLHFTGKHDKTGFLDITINPLKDKDNNLKGFLLTGEDITKKKNLEIRLAHAQKMESVGKLSAGIAHEINTPIQYITDNSFFLQNSFGSLTELITKSKELVIAIDNGINTDTIVNDIKNLNKKFDLDYLINEIPRAISQSIDGLTRIAKIVQSVKSFAGTDHNIKTAVNINKALEDTINISRNEWKYAAEIKTMFDENLPLIPCFPGELNQAFLGIIMNSVDAIKEKNADNINQKGLIKIGTSIKNKIAVITIKDSGNGIPDELMTKIFDPFFSTKKQVSGTGQGLYIVYDIIVNKHQGSIYFKSSPGAGTTCFIKLPIAEKK